MYLYKGSVKNILRKSSDTLEFEFTDDYSVFDYGKMPNSIEGKGKALADLAEFFFRKVADPDSWKNLDRTEQLQKAMAHYPGLDAELQYLSSHGLCHHFIRRTKPNALEVKEVKINRPKEVRWAGFTWYDYSKTTSQQMQLVPLEVVFRFGVTRGSSFFERADSDYLALLGLSENLAEEKEFDFPIIEFFTKLEPKDRFVSHQEAFILSNLPEKEFIRLIQQTILVAFMVKQQFTAAGLELIDGKLEWSAFNSGLNSGLMLVDSIGPDELRVVDPQTKIPFSKEFLRQFYRGTSWYKELLDYKLNQVDWKEHVSIPPKLPKQWAETASQMYSYLPKALLKPQSPNQISERIKECIQQTPSKA
ncbi:MAG: phosphoribosylaminoimidazolesuccinocarboxamide synthase [Bacteriovoracia bacterium]